MVQYVSRSELLSLGTTNFAANVARVQRAEKRSPTSSTFLSHSSADDEVMPAVVLILENHGADVYLDKKDATLTGKPVREIATTLRSRITQCKKFMLFASEHIKSSKWVPWELGLADGSKRSPNVAVFPAPEKSYEYQWTEQEYLGVYDRVVWGKLEGHQDPLWMVYNQADNTAVTLRHWLTRI